jgi:hypothetical protein
VYTAGVTSPYGTTTTESLVVVGLYALSVGAGTFAQVEVWDRRPPPAAPARASVQLLPTGTGLVLTGSF